MTIYSPMLATSVDKKVNKKLKTLKHKLLQFPGICQVFDTVNLFQDNILMPINEGKCTILFLGDSYDLMKQTMTDPYFSNPILNMDDISLVIGETAQQNLQI